MTSTTKNKKDAMMDVKLTFTNEGLPVIVRDGVEEPLINITQAVALVRTKEGYERFDGSTLRRHCVDGTITEKVKCNREWMLSESAVWQWLETHYTTPRVPYELKNPRKNGRKS